MQTLEATLRDFNIRLDDTAAIVKLARSLHRVGIARRKSTVAWQREGIKNCNLARDMITFVREVKNPIQTNYQPIPSQ